MRATTPPRTPPTPASTPPQRGRVAAASEDDDQDELIRGARPRTPSCVDETAPPSSTRTATKKKLPAGSGGVRPSAALVEQRTRGMARLLSEGLSIRQAATVLKIPLRTAERTATKARLFLASATAGEAAQLRGEALERARAIAREARSKGALGVALNAEKFISDLLGLDHATGGAGPAQNPYPGTDESELSEEELLDGFISNTGILARYIAKRSTSISREARDVLGDAFDALDARFREAERAAAPPPYHPAPAAVPVQNYLAALDQHPPVPDDVPMVPAFREAEPAEVVETVIASRVEVMQVDRDGFQTWLNALPWREPERR